MKLSSFVDFYILEALRVATENDPEPLLHSHTRLARDINYEYGRVSTNMAHMLADYLWLAAMGDARWASKSATFNTPSLPVSSGRSLRVEVHMDKPH